MYACMYACICDHSVGSVFIYGCVYVFALLVVAKSKVHVCMCVYVCVCMYAHMMADRSLEYVFQKGD
jgi:hypothetical protein